MRLARVELGDGRTTSAVQCERGLVRADGDVLTGDVTVTDEIVTPARWLPPVVPAAILCIGRNYAEHAAEGGAPPPEYPIVFMKNPFAATGHENPICIPRVCDDEVDYEGELVVVMGRPAYNVPREKALEYVLGYTVGNDVSARLWQTEKGGSQWCRGKGFDTFAPLGPVMVTADEIPDPSNLTIRTTLDGEQVQNSDTSKMIFDVPALISFLSQDTTLQPGTIIMTGTPEGVGWARQPRLTLKPGDEVTIEIGDIGRLTNRVVSADG